MTREQGSGVENDATAEAEPSRRDRRLNPMHTKLLMGFLVFASLMTISLQCIPAAGAFGVCSSSSSTNAGGTYSYTHCTAMVEQNGYVLCAGYTSDSQTDSSGHTSASSTSCQTGV